MTADKHAALRLWAGISPEQRRRLARLDIHCATDLLFHLPLRYEDETRLTPIADLRVGVTAQVEVEVVRCELVQRPRRHLLAQLRDASGQLYGRWLHFYPSQQKMLAPGKLLRLYGEPRAGFYGLEMVHPRLRVAKAEGSLPSSLTPVYPTISGLSQPTLRKLILRALDELTPAELLPASLLDDWQLPALQAALRALHQPPAEADMDSLESRQHPAWRRFKLEELLVQQLCLRRAYAARRAHRAPPLAAPGQLAAALLAQLPFAPTAAQRRASAEINADLASPHPMQRLLQGDVGSGKTLVAVLAMLQAVDSGYQAVMMAPTEILAEQHWQKLSAWLQPLGLEVVWLASSRSKRERDAALAALREGRVQLAVGTHALIEETVLLPRLGLAIIDEQHRFGVRQRLALRDKGGGGEAAQQDLRREEAPALRPHLLMMSATPIPRTLAMTHYADVDVSVLDELPPGRTPIRTHLVAAARRDEVIARIGQACAEGRQAYWVCPLIEESETLQLQTAVDTHQTLLAALPALRIGLVHGRLKADEKSATMAAFAAGELDVLVATTVIEVGVDVPNASLMVIEHAERFGLAQLHQLRGRVGRGALASVCVLIYAQPLSQQGRERLKVIYQHTDGFAIARADLAIRGPGEFIGARQSGVPMLRYAKLESDATLIDPARNAAEQLLATAPATVDALLQRWLGHRADLLHA